MFLFSIKSRPNPNSEIPSEHEDVGGAYVNCYISFKDQHYAEKLARLLIKDSGWIPGKDMETWILRKKNLDKEEDLEYYSEALKYGYCLVFYTWPADAEDADDDSEGTNGR